MFSCFTSLRNRTVAVLASVIVASCAMQPVPTLAAPITTFASTPSAKTDFCVIATEYNLNWHSLLNRGVTVEQVVEMHMNVMQQKNNKLPPELVEVLNYMLYLTTINKDTDSDVVVEGLYESCNKAIQQVISSKKRSTL